MKTAKLLEDNAGERAFTLIELMTVMVIMLILATVSLSSFAYLRERSERASCVSNLQNLFTAGTAYLVDHDNVWPQIPVSSIGTPPYAQAWISVFTPYQLGPVNWICPTTQRAMGNPNFLNAQAARVDYIGMPFGSQPYTAFRWPTQPWFEENGPGHGDGPMFILTNGQVLSLNQSTQITAQPMP